MIEGPEMSYSFDGNVTDSGDVSVVVPSFKNILKEGIYDTRLEVFVNDRYFVPLKLKADFRQSINVIAESFNSERKKPKATAAFISNNSKKKKTTPNTKRKIAETKTKRNSPTLTDNDLLSIIRNAVRGDSK
tara:strand:- start:399 stop:794 length:396 start_codon:yes stop_codon:yes gene_type:complete